MNTPTVYSRSSYWDIVKGIAILLVIAGHQIQFSCGNGELFVQDPIYKFIYGFHMPLFMLVSGYFFYNSTERHSAQEIIKARIRQCILPIATISILVQFFKWDFSPISVYVRFSGNSLWFLWVLFYLSCLTLVIRKFPPPPVWAIIYVVSFILPSIGISSFLWYMYPFFAAGFLINKYMLLEKMFCRWKLLKATTILLGVLYILLLLCFKKETYIYWSSYSILNGGGWHQSIVNIQRTITGFAGSFFLIGMVRIFYKYGDKFLEKLLCYLGKNTLQLYIISTLPFFIQSVKYFGDGRVNYLLSIVSFIIVLCVSIVIIETLKKNRYTNFIFFGQKLNNSKNY